MYKNNPYRKIPKMNEKVWVKSVGKLGTVKYIEKGLQIGVKEFTITAYVIEFETPTEISKDTNFSVVIGEMEKYCKKGYGGAFTEIVSIYDKPGKYMSLMKKQNIILQIDYDKTLLKCMKCFKEFKYDETIKKNCPHCHCFTNIVEVYDE